MGLKFDFHLLFSPVRFGEVHASNTDHFRFEKIEMKTVIEYLPVLIKHNQRPVCLLTISLRVPTQPSKYLCPYNKP
jgi:hypothetical protein